jgi:hypothetical protein
VFTVFSSTYVDLTVNPFFPNFHHILSFSFDSLVSYKSELIPATFLLSHLSVLLILILPCPSVITLLTVIFLSKPDYTISGTGLTVVNHWPMYHSKSLYQSHHQQPCRSIVDNLALSISPCQNYESRCILLICDDSGLLFMYFLLKISCHISELFSSFHSHFPNRLTFMTCKSNTRSPTWSLTCKWVATWPGGTFSVDILATGIWT